MNVVKFESLKKRREHSPTFSETYGMSNADETFTAMMNKDIENLALATGQTAEEAIIMAGDFYKKYPMLMEYVRSPEYMLRKGK